MLAPGQKSPSYICHFNVLEMLHHTVEEKSLEEHLTVTCTDSEMYDNEKNLEFVSILIHQVRTIDTFPFYVGTGAHISIIVEKNTQSNYPLREHNIISKIGS